MIVDITFVEVLIIGNEFTCILAELVLFNYHYGGDNAGDNQYQCKCDYGTGYLFVLCAVGNFDKRKFKVFYHYEGSQSNEYYIDEEEVEGSYNVERI